MSPRNRYKEMERYMTYVLLTDLALFLLYLCFSWIIWLKVILAVVIVLISGLCIAFLYLTKELFKHRSLWMGTAAASILVCLFFSLILNFP